MNEYSVRSAVLLDPHPLWLDAIERLLERIGFSVVGSSTSSSDALELVDEHRPHMVVVSVDLGTTPGECVDVIRRMTERAPHVKVIAVSADDDAALVSAALDAGAVAYIVKTAHADDVAAAIRQSFDQSVYLAAGRIPGSSSPVTITDRGRDRTGAGRSPSLRPLLRRLHCPSQERGAYICTVDRGRGDELALSSGGDRR